MVAKLTCMRGLPGSGKSSQARKIAQKSDAVVICRDNLRQMLHGTYWSGRRECEDRVTLVEEAQVSALLRAGISTIIDAQHLHTPYLRKWAKLATRLGVDFEVVDVHADTEECKRRAYARWQRPGLDFGRYIDPEVIDKQAKRFPVEKWPVITATPFRPEPVEWIKGLPEAIICDIDSTLAFIPTGGRSPYDRTRVSEDGVNEEIAWLVRELFNMRYTGAGPRILIVSGRDDICRGDTAKWLADNDIPFDELYMRPTEERDERGNKVADYVVKYGLHRDYIRGRYNVKFVLDDRRQVIDMWRHINLRVLDVAGNEF